MWVGWFRVFILSSLLFVGREAASSETPKCNDNLQPNVPSSSEKPASKKYSIYGPTGEWQNIGSRDIGVLHTEVFQPPHKTQIIQIPADEIKNLAMGFSGAWPWMSFRNARPYEKYLDLLTPMGFDPSKYEGKHLVDIGCGLSPAVDQFVLQNKIDAVGVDLSFIEKFRTLDPKFNYETNKQEAEAKGLSMVRRIGASPTHLPMGDNSVDVVISIDGISGLPRIAKQQALAEMIRILRNGSHAFLVITQAEESSAIAQVLLQWGVLFDAVGNNIIFTKSSDVNIRQVN